MLHIPLSPRCGLGGRDFLRASPPSAARGGPAVPQAQSDPRKKTFPLKTQMFPACRGLAQGCPVGAFLRPLHVTQLSPVSLGTHHSLG